MGKALPGQPPVKRAGAPPSPRVPCLPAVPAPPAACGPEATPSPILPHRAGARGWRGTLSRAEQGPPMPRRCQASTPGEPRLWAGLLNTLLGTWRLRPWAEQAGVQVRVCSARGCRSPRSGQTFSGARGGLGLVGPSCQARPHQLSLRSFVFLQLYHSPFFGDESNKPILLPNEVGMLSLPCEGPWGRWGAQWDAWLWVVVAVALSSQWQPVVICQGREAG